MEKTDWQNFVKSLGDIPATDRIKYVSIVAVKNEARFKIFQGECVAFVDDCLIMNTCSGNIAITIKDVSVVYFAGLVLASEAQKIVSRLEKEGGVKYAFAAR